MYSILSLSVENNYVNIPYCLLSQDDVKLLMKVSTIEYKPKIGMKVVTKLAKKVTIKEDKITEYLRTPKIFGINFLLSRRLPLAINVLPHGNINTDKLSAVLALRPHQQIISDFISKHYLNQQMASNRIAGCILKAETGIGKT